MAWSSSLAPQLRNAVVWTAEAGQRSHQSTHRPAPHRPALHGGSHRWVSHRARDGHRAIGPHRRHQRTARRRHKRTAARATSAAHPRDTFGARRLRAAEKETSRLRVAEQETSDCAWPNRRPADWAWPKKRRGPNLAIEPSKPRQRPTLPQTCACSTIGPEELNFRVRDGNGCDLFGVATRKKIKRSAKPGWLGVQRKSVCARVSAIDRLHLAVPEINKCLWEQAI